MLGSQNLKGFQAIIERMLLQNCGEHPMLEEHYIPLIAAVTDDTVTIRFPKPGDAPELKTFSKSGKVEAYEICNLHGFWKGEG